MRKRRPGGGRKRIPGIITYGVRITPAQAALLKMWGGGNMSAGMRWLINEAKVLVVRQSVTG